MHTSEKRENAEKMLGILQAFAPTGKAQELCATNHRAMLADGMSYEDVICAEAGAILDGLTDGNWPWVESRKPR